MLELYQSQLYQSQLYPFLLVLKSIMFIVYIYIYIYIVNSMISMDQKSLLQRAKNAAFPVTQAVSAVILLQRFYRHCYYKRALPEPTECPNARLLLIKSFVQFYERKYREPVVNAAASRRNDAFRDYAARLVLHRWRLYRARQALYSRTFLVYKQAALTIYGAFAASPLARGDFIKIVKTRRI